MASVSRESIGTLHEIIKVKLEKEDYVPSFEKSLKQYAKNANIPGFRKGMVPAGMLRKMYGQSLFNEEIIRTVGKKLEDYMKAEKLNIFAQPMVVRDQQAAAFNMDKPGEINFSFEIGLKPEFDIPALKEKPVLTRYRIKPSEKMLDNEIAELQRKFGETENLLAVENGDETIHCTYEPCDADGNKEIGTGHKIESTISLDKLPVKLKEQLMGLKPEQGFVFRPIDTCTPEELPVFLKDSLKTGESAAEKYYHLTITNIYKIIPKELGKELFMDVFRNDAINDEAAFREELRKGISADLDGVVRERLHNEIFELLVHNTPIDLPIAFLKRWIKEGDEHNPKTEQEVEQSFGSFEHSLRWQLITDKIIIDNKITVTEEDVYNDVKQKVMSHFGMADGGNEEGSWLEPYVAKLVSDEKTADKTAQRILGEKIFNFLETQFTLEEKEISEEDLLKLPNAHDAHHHHH